MSMTFKQAFKQRRRQFQKWLLPALGYPPLWLLCATLRLRVTDPAGVLKGWQQPAGAPQILVFWHDELFAMPWLYRKAGFKRPASVMISRNLSGEVIAVIAKKFGIDAARGSPSKGGREACRELVEVLGKGELAGITPDGSRGPRHRLKSGVFLLAKTAKADVVPMRMSHQWRICLPTWDRFQVPLPFSRVSVSILPPIAWDDPQLEAKLKAVMEGV